MRNPAGALYRAVAFVVAVAAAIVLVPPQPQQAFAESPNCGATVPALRNGGFEAPAQSANSVTQQSTPNSQLVWLNTAESNIEMWHQVFQGVSAYEGSQFVELNAFVAGTLYQDLATIPGSQMTYTLAHKARSRDGETVVVLAGPPGGSLQEIGRFPANINGPDRNGWTVHASSTPYTVPAGQTTTRFAFQSDGSTTIAPGSGNFLDAIEFTLVAGACDDAVTIRAGQSAPGVGVLANDIGTGLRITSLGTVSPAGAGTAAIAGENISFTPQPTFSGRATIPYTIRDAGGVTSSAALVVTVRPVAVADVFDVTQNRPQSLPVLDNDLGSNLEIVSVATAQHGTATITPDKQRIAYTPAELFTGTDTFAYTVAGDPGGFRQSATVTVTVDAASDMSITQGPAPTVIRIGDVFGYDLTITNGGPSTAVDPTVTLTLPAGMSLVGGANCTPSSGPTAVCRVSTLGEGSAYTFKPELTTTTTGAGQSITAVVSTGTVDPNPSNDVVTQSVTVDPAADLAVANPAVPGGATPGTPVTFEVDVTNGGPSPGTGASVRITLIPAGDLTSPAFTVDAAPVTCTDAGGGAWDCPLGDLASGATRAVSVTADLASGASADAVQFAAAASAGPHDPDPTNNETLQGATVTPEADLEITGNLVSASPLVPGGTATFAFTVDNNGPSSAPNAHAVFDLPSGLTVPGPVSGCTITVNRVTCDLGTLASGGSWTQLFSAEIDAAVAGDVDVTGTASSAVPDPNAANDTVTVPGPVQLSADLGVLIGSTSVNHAGAPASIVVSAFNTGPSDATGVTITLTAPLLFTPFTSIPPFCSSAGQTVTCNLDMTSGATSNVAIAGQWFVTAAGSQAFTATVAATAPAIDPVPGNNTATRNVTVETATDLAISGTLTPQPIVPGGTAFYSLSAENRGPSNSPAGATIALPIPAGLTAGAPLPAGCSEAAGTVTCTLPAIDAGSSQGRVIPVTADPGLSGTVSTIATVAPAPGVTDPDPTNDEVVVTDDAALPEADLTVLPVAASIDGVPGASAAPSFLVRNLGPSDAPDTPLRVSFPAGYTFVSATGASCGPGAVATEVLCGGGPLAAGADEVVTVTLDVPADATGTAQVNAEALESIPPAAPILTDPVPGNNGATVTVSLVPAADLSAAGSGPATLTPGTNADWQATITNGGPSVATGAALVFTPGPDLGFVAAPGCSESGGVVTCPVASLAPGGTATFDLTTAVAAGATGKEFVRIEVSGPAFDPDPKNDVVYLVAKDAPLVDLEVTGTVAPNPVDAGDQATWTFTVANAGPSDASGVSLVPTLPSELTIVSVVGATCSGPAPVTCDLGPLAAGSSADLVVVTDVDPLAAGLLEVTAEATPVEVEATPGDNLAVVGLLVTPLALCDGRPVTLFAPPGGALVEGTPGDDVIQGTDGADLISGRGGNDTICGLGGDDVLLGGPGDDTLLGGDGDDKLRGASGDDDLRGGGGKDRLLPETGTDVVDGGPGWDILDYRAADGPVSVDLGAGTAVYTPVGGAQQTASVSQVENVDGSGFDDILVGDAKRNVLRGKQGDDTIDGGGADDRLDGGIGADLVRGGDGDDVVRGRDGDDTLSGDGGADLVVGGYGSDVLGGGSGDDDLRGGLIRHEGLYANTMDGGAGSDVCRWAFDAPVNCETTF